VGRPALTNILEFHWKSPSQAATDTKMKTRFHTAKISAKHYCHLGGRSQDETSGRICTLATPATAENRVGAGDFLLGRNGPLWPLGGPHQKTGRFGRPQYSC